MLRQSWFATPSQYSTVQKRATQKCSCAMERTISFLNGGGGGGHGWTISSKRNPAQQKLLK